MKSNYKKNVVFNIPLSTLMFIIIFVHLGGFFMPNQTILIYCLSHYFPMLLIGFVNYEYV